MQSRQDAHVGVAEFTVPSLNITQPLRWSSHANQKSWRTKRLAKTIKKLTENDKEMARTQRAIEESKLAMGEIRTQMMTLDVQRGEQSAALNQLKVTRESLYQTALEHKIGVVLDRNWEQQQRGKRKRKSDSSADPPLVRHPHQGAKKGESFQECR